MRILLSGIPGGGKTWLGEELRRRYGFTHLDMEAQRFTPAQDCMEDPDAFAERIPAGDVVATWGFDPFVALDAVRSLVKAGFVPIWIDGDHTLFFSTFMRRECANAAMELAFYGQMENIIRTRVRDQVDWLFLDPYTAHGAFRSGNADRLLALARKEDRP